MTTPVTMKTEINCFIINQITKANNIVLIGLIETVNEYILAGNWISSENK